MKQFSQSWSLVQSPQSEPGWTERRLWIVDFLQRIDNIPTEVVERTNNQ
jgi:hypothetical protein